MSQHITSATRMTRGQSEGETVGLDVGDRYAALCVVDAAGDVVEEGRVRTTPAAIRQRFAAAPRQRVVLETGTHSLWLSALLTECGHEVVVANARRLRLIAEHDTKSDRTDAETLARLGRVDPALLAPIRHRARGTQADLAVVRARDVVVRARTLLVNHVRGAVKAVGARVPACSTHAFAGRARPAVPEELVPALGAVFGLLEELNRVIAGYDRAVATRCASAYPETARLTQVAGVGPLTALAYVLTLEDPARFPRRRGVGAYLGLSPKQASSGARTPQLRITKAGDGMLRRLLVGSAHYILGPFGPDCELRRWGIQLAARGGKNAKKRAVVAVARKLAVVLHALWTTGERYEPLRHARGVSEPMIVRA
jgi:transposase